MPVMRLYNNEELDDTVSDIKQKLDEKIITEAVIMAIDKNNGWNSYTLISDPFRWLGMMAVVGLQVLLAASEEEE
jgi:hypothetical protein